MRKAFYLYKRERKSGRPVFYMQLPAENGGRTSAISTGQTNRTAAEHWAMDFLKKGGSLPAQGRMTFEQYGENWWNFEKCPYIKGKTARGFHISQGYARVRRSYLERHVLPSFGKTKLSNITPRQIESWVMGLLDEGRLSPATINRALGTLKVMLSEAVRLQIIQLNPASPVGELKEKPKPRGILGLDHMRALFFAERVSEVWGDPRHLCANLLAASTGMRLGEVQGLQVQYVHPGYVSVVHGWNDTYGLSQPKWNSTREIPIPTRVSTSLQSLINHSPYQEPESLVIWGKDSQHPLTKTTLLAGLRRALKRIGISLEQQKTENLCFHSWRHGLNTLLRSKVPDEQLRRVTGHKTLAMSDNYDHAGAEHLADVLAVQESYFS